MRIMISQPMGGLSDEEILSVREVACKHLEELGNEVADTWFTDSPPMQIKNNGVWYLGISIMEMAKCDGVYFCKGWENAKGCRIEHEVAKIYGLSLLYEQ